MRIAFLLFAIANIFTAQPIPVQTDSSFVTMTFNHKVGDDLLEQGKTYNNPFNESFTVRRFKYYLSNLTFRDLDGSSSDIPSYFLIDEDEPASKTLRIPLKAGTYKSVSFLIGVDSVKNVSGTQTGALDPMNGMFWTWNSGYIMAKLEGTSPLSKSPNNLVEYHIGGFRFNQNTVRKITLSFPSGDGLKIDNKPMEVVVEADLNKWFSGAHDLKISEHTVCTTPGNLALKYADNYANMFTITSVNYSTPAK